MIWFLAIMMIIGAGSAGYDLGTQHTEPQPVRTVTITYHDCPGSAK